MSLKKFDVKKMAEALQSGAVMMADHCESCGAPLFRYRDGRVKCVNCNKLYKPSPLREGLEELSSLEYVMDEAISLLRNVEKHILEIKDEEKLKSVIEDLRKILSRLIEKS
ncbi:MAG: autoantigen p27 domain-containing protein [Crenarchaeota archaeon]|nr:autoantigen p27 domain-containing protein [Thermoproteota archaeon]MDW8033969.1 Sjogren's syndrome/scleroderma autoantigen 1 family protein [Nitrososphaerota archaeon]